MNYFTRWILNKFNINCQVPVCIFMEPSCIKVKAVTRWPNILGAFYGCDNKRTRVLALLI